MESPRSPKRRRILSSINPPDSDDDEQHGRQSRSRDDTLPAKSTTPRSEDAGRDDHDTTTPRPTRFRFKSKSSRSSRSRREGDEDDDRRHRRHPRRDQHTPRSRSPHRDDDDGDRHRSRRSSRSRDRAASPSAPDASTGEAGEERRRHRRHHHHHHHHHRHSGSRRRRRHRHRHRSPTPPSKAAGQPREPDPFEDPPLSPETAFRESLFDALADDEGAAYWEAVYGQPIHIYAPPTGDGSGGGGGVLERMTDEEYAAYVRQKMWERTHAGLLEARARREREREREREEERARREEQARVAREMERCLRRGEERRKKRAWRDKWDAYVRRWKEWEEAGKTAAARGGGGGGGGGGGERGEGGEGDGPAVEAMIPWPEGVDTVLGVEKETDKEKENWEVQAEAVRAFFVQGIGLEELGEKEFAARLKEERVRWHPDKMQQRLGGRVDARVMRTVTAVFQVVDALWNDTRKQRG